jgi:hypothetical protein
MTMRPRHNAPETPPGSGPDPAHAPGKHRKGPPPVEGHATRRAPTSGTAHQPWLPTSGLIGKKRRSARRS